ncbi:MAG: hypothetical protein ABSC23_05640 [Bryobacteraceae bacterium]
MNADWSEPMGTGATVGAGNYPAKYSFTTSTPSCSDFVVFNTSVAGSSTQATILAYTNLYNPGCGSVPTVYWAYNTTTGDAISTSVSLSLDGTQVAFISTNTSVAYLNVLRFASGQGTASSPATPTVTAVPATYVTCKSGSGSCLLRMAFTALSGQAAPNDLISSPFCDYTGDIIYVGDSYSGGSYYSSLHKFTGVFKGTPAEAGSPWPVSSGAASGSNLNRMTSPVYDYSSGLVYATNYATTLNETTPAGVQTVSGNSDISTAQYDILEGPIVDSTNGKVYLFATGAANNTVFQFPTNFASGAGGKGWGTAPVVTTYVGAGSGSSRPVGDPPPQLYYGAFDNAFYTTGTGNLYVCGNTGSNTAAGTPILYQIPITSGAMSATAITGPTLTSAGTQCSPVTEVYNNANSVPYDWIYLGVQASGSASGCGGGGCVMGITVNHWLASTSYSLGQMVVDNTFNIEVVTTAGTSGSSQPTWPAAGSAGTVTSDGSTQWTSQGPFTFTGFTASHAYALKAVIVDGNNNLQRVTTAGTSAASGPAWATGFGATTTSGGVTFINQGPSGIVGTAYSGGTSGIVVDNISATPGDSNIYFSTLSGGNAIQASQSAP